MVNGWKSFAVNGESVAPQVENGYAVVTRKWNPGDRIELELPMNPQRVFPDERIKADEDLVALTMGPLVYSVETADNGNIDQKVGSTPLRAEWRPDLLGGVVTVAGKWADGSDLLAVPKLRSNEPRRSSASLPWRGGQRFGKYQASGKAVRSERCFSGELEGMDLIRAIADR